MFLRLINLDRTSRADLYVPIGEWGNLELSPPPLSAPERGGPAFSIGVLNYLHTALRKASRRVGAEESVE